MLQGVSKREEMRGNMNFDQRLELLRGTIGQGAIFMLEACATSADFWPCVVQLEQKIRDCK